MVKIEVEQEESVLAGEGFLSQSKIKNNTGRGIKYRRVIKIRNEEGVVVEEFDDERYSEYESINWGKTLKIDGEGIYEVEHRIKWEEIDELGTKSNILYGRVDVVVERV